MGSFNNAKRIKVSVNKWPNITFLFQLPSTRVRISATKKSLLQELSWNLSTFTTQKASNMRQVRTFRKVSWRRKFPKPAARRSTSAQLWGTPPRELGLPDPPRLRCVAAKISRSRTRLKEQPYFTVFRPPPTSQLVCYPREKMCESSRSPLVPLCDLQEDLPHSTLPHQSEDNQNRCETSGADFQNKNLNSKFIIISTTWNSCPVWAAKRGCNSIYILALRIDLIWEAKSSRLKLRLK